MISRRIVIAASAALALLTLSACGGGQATGPSRADYIARAERICRDTTAQAAPLLRRFAAGAASLNATSARKLAPVGERIHALASAYIARLRALPQPAADRAKIARFLSLSREVIDGLGQAATALSAGHTVEVLGTLQGVQATANDANAAAVAYGLRDCAKVLAIG